MPRKSGRPRTGKCKRINVLQEFITAMKTSFIVFASIVLIIYTFCNIYLYIRGYQALEIMGRRRIWFSALFWITALSFIATQVLRMKNFSGVLFDAVSIVGSLWIAIMLYGFIIAMSVDILRLVAWIFNIRFDFKHIDYNSIKAITFGTVCIALSAILIFGYNNALRPRTTHLEIPIDKHAGKLRQLRVAMVSDIHLGYIIGAKELARIVDVINGQRPDIVVLVGDVFDSSSEPVIAKDMGAAFSRLQTKYGAYIAVGNHEYIGERAKRNAMTEGLNYLSSRGVQPLLDSVVLIDDSFYLAARKDLMSGARKTIPELLQGINKNLPVILLDHQPFLLNEAEEAEVDLQLSGHTHHGQMWPLNYITGKLFEQDWGFLQKGKSNFYVSCGAGTWGPPIRTAGYSEVVVIDLMFKNEK